MASTNPRVEADDSVAEKNPTGIPVDSPPSQPELPEVNAASAAEALRDPKADPSAAVEPPTDAKAEDLPPLTKEEMIQEALDCPCIASMKDGPCGTKFLFAYECFLRSESEPKGSNCVEAFVQMHECMNEHPEVYDLDDEDADPAELRSAPAREGASDSSAFGMPDMPAPAPEPIQVSKDATADPAPVPAPSPAVPEPEPVIKSGIPQPPPIAAASIYEGYARRALPGFALRQLSRFFSS